ncbi:hypothetical protein PG994_005241 [Apiospora phragmitis]|uniref:Methyltransferase n=1 Tax=Apiospora phragmitis TaxID=2905665 RepID=A0ABR1VT04_9PEZI
MHYIRLLRPVSVETTNRREDVLSVLLTITTDLGDSFFGPDEPLALGVTLETTTGSGGGRRRRAPSLLACPADDKSPLQWRAGMRALKARLRLREPLPDAKTTVCIFARSSRRSKTPSTRPYWRHGYDDDDEQHTELIVPVSVDMVNRTCAPVSLRTLPLSSTRDDEGGDDASDNNTLAFGEDIGESIARHIWDAGLVTASFLSESCRSAAVMADILPVRQHCNRLNILELGCGVGILGTTVAGIIWDAAAAQGTFLVEANVLLTDVEEAEERARTNIARAEEVLLEGHSRRNRLSGSGEEDDDDDEESEEKPRTTQLQYENLDWEDGRQGAFGRLAAARAWDFVVLSDCTYNIDSLPALVGTLSALRRHSSSSSRSKVAAARDVGAAETGTETGMRVILATKPRHASEEALFGLLAEQGWSHRVVKRIPLPRVNAEDEVVEIYVVERGGQEGVRHTGLQRASQSSSLDAAPRRT